MSPNQLLRTVACRSCGAPMIFLATAAGRGRMPVNAGTVTDGDEFYDSKKHESHFATCPAAKKWRKR